MKQKSFYIELNSAYRDRTQFPNQAEFIVPIGNTGNTQDVILNSFPSTSFVALARNHGPAVFTGGNPSRVKLDATASTIDDYYNGMVITDTTTGETSIIQSYNGNSQTALLYFPFSSGTWQSTDTFTITDNSNFSNIFDPDGKNIDGYNVGNLLYNVDEDEFRTIVSYDAVSQMYTVDSPFSNFSGQTFEVRKAEYIVNGTALALTANTMTLAVSNTGDYTGQYIRFMSGALQDQVFHIVSYDTTTRIATFTPNLIVPGPLPTYEILQYSSNNIGHIPNFHHEAGVYEVELIDLILPNTTLNNNVGGRIAFYPYVYVQFENVSKGVNHIINSNNPNCVDKLFRCPITDTNSPLLATFVKINSSFMKHKIYFNSTNNIYFRVTLSDGSLFETVESDNMSPQPPNAALQISALFKLTKL